ncbi:MAG: HD domain-containing protein [Treponema sp.]|nr:HD domain-containing protein [Treponema sp.]
MMEFLQRHQLTIMLFLSGICSVLALLSFFTKSLSKHRRYALIVLEVSASLLLIMDRLAYIYRGNVSDLGWWMVRISNFCVYLFSLTIIHAFNLYIVDLVKNEGQLKRFPKRLLAAEVLYSVGVVLIILSQFIGLYYSFDATNHYTRNPAFVISYIFPLGMVILQLTVIVQLHGKISRKVFIPMLLFAFFPLAATIIQIFTYGLSLTNIAIVGMSILLYVFVLIDINDSVERANNREIELIKEEQKNVQIMFEQTASALANAIDAKDVYTHGHSMRVAEYARKIAENAGKSQKECDDIYFAGLLHDVGKIGVAGSIINKGGKLTEEEFAEIKKHPEIGRQILSGISKSPYLSIAANSHHERFDGQGYPEGLKGSDIPEIARIIAIADAYDAMTSKRSYRDPIPQDKVREEIVKGIDTQFDPDFAKIMLHLIDLDTEYQMKEHEEIKELAGKDELICGEYKTSYSGGIVLNQNITRIKMLFNADKEFVSEKTIPSLIVFDSLDARIHLTEEKQKDLLYLEYGEVRFDGKVNCEAARKVETEIIKHEDFSKKDWKALYAFGLEYEIEACKYKDHLLIIIKNVFQTIKVTFALPDSARYAYIAFTGEHCTISKVDVKKLDEQIDQNYIPRIAEEISYINVPAGDVPNVQVDGWRSDSTQGIAVKDGMTLSFHSQSLPTARLIWHCPFVVLFYSKDKKIEGDEYLEYGLIRLDGENWESKTFDGIKIMLNKTERFDGWNAWKEANKQGIDCTVSFKRDKDSVTVFTENCGIEIKAVIKLQDNLPEIYAALTGDQCAITNIRIS